MIDHVLMFATEAEATQVLPEKYFNDSTTIKNLTVSLGEFVFPGYFMAVALDAPDDFLIKLPNEACRIVSDREAAKFGENFFLYVAPSVDLNLLSTAVISPVYFGSEYPFCAG